VLPWVGHLKKLGASGKLTDLRIMRVTLKAINEALNGLVPDVRLAKGDGYSTSLPGKQRTGSIRR